MGPSGSILPAAYFDGLSTLWGGCAFVASALVAAGLAFQAAQNRGDPGAIIRLVVRVFFIGIATLFIREWLMRLNDIVIAFAALLGVDPLAVDNKFVTFISGKTDTSPTTSVWDVIWGTKSIGTAVSYALLWLFGWLSWGLQYIVKLVGDILLTAGWSISPIFLAFFMIRPMSGVALRYVIGLVGLVCWPFGWVIAAVVTNSMIDAAATANLLPVAIAGSSMVAPGITVLLVGAWMIVSSILAPYVTTKVLLMGANPATAFAQGTGGVLHSGLAGGLGAASTAVTGGGTAATVIASAAMGALASGTESAARGGGSARMSSTLSGGVQGLYQSGMARQHLASAQSVAQSQARRAAAAERFTSEFHQNSQRRQTKQAYPEPGASATYHSKDPTREAEEIMARARSTKYLGDGATRSSN